MCFIDWNRSSSSVPRLRFPEEVFVNVGKWVGSEVNRSLGYLQDVACGGTIKQFLVVVSHSSSCLPQLPSSGKFTSITLEYLLEKPYG